MYQQTQIKLTFVHRNWLTPDGVKNFFDHCFSLSLSLFPTKSQLYKAVAQLIDLIVFVFNLQDGLQVIHCFESLRRPPTIAR